MKKTKKFKFIYTVVEDENAIVELMSGARVRQRTVKENIYK